MLVVKITILLVVITTIFNYLIKAYMSGKPGELFRFKFDKHYLPWYVWVNGILVITSIIGIISSVIYLLFLK